MLFLALSVDEERHESFFPVWCFDSFYLDFVYAGIRIFQQVCCKLSEFVIFKHQLGKFLRIKNQFLVAEQINIRVYVLNREIDGLKWLEFELVSGADC